MKLEWGNPDNPNIFEQKGYTKEDLKKGIRNPFIDRFCRKVSVLVNHKDYELFKEIAEAYDITPERKMQTTLEIYANLLREEDTVIQEKIHRRDIGMYIFEWDEEKNEINKRKHDVSFEDAVTVFDDNNAVYLPDEKHSINEMRFYIIGKDAYDDKLTVCHCYRNGDEIVRIISAWNATKQEIKIYYKGGDYYV